MMQMNYNQATPNGVAGALVDLSAHVVDTRLNESGTALKFGMGVVHGTTPGSDIKIPVAGTTAAEFEGVVVHTYANEMDMSGAVAIQPFSALSVMRYGRIWVRLEADITPAYGDPLYLIIDGDDAGAFTNTADTPTDGATAKTVAVKGRFIGGKGTGDVAPVELYNQNQV